MTEMIISGGVRYRAEDAKALDIAADQKVATQAAPTAPDTGPDATAPDTGATAPDADLGFDPNGRSVEEVLTALNAVRDNPDAIARIKEFEAKGKDRITIADWQPA